MCRAHLVPLQMFILGLEQEKQALKACKALISHGKLTGNDNTAIYVSSSDSSFIFVLSRDHPPRNDKKPRQPYLLLNLQEKKNKKKKKKKKKKKNKQKKKKNKNKKKKNKAINNNIKLKSCCQWL